MPGLLEGQRLSVPEVSKIHLAGSQKVGNGHESQSPVVGDQVPIDRPHYSIVPLLCSDRSRWPIN